MQLLALLLATSITMMSNMVIAPTLPVISKAFLLEDPQGILTRLLLTAPAIITIFAAPLAGLWGDHWKRVPILIMGMVLFAIFGSAGLWISDLHHLLYTRLALGIAVGMLMASSSSLMGDYYSGDARNKAMGYQGMANALGGVLFMVAGGALGALSWRAPFSVYLLGLVYAVIVVVFLPEPSHQNHEQRGGDGKELKTQWGRVSLMFGTGLLGITCFFLIPVNIAFLLQERLGMEGAAVGMVMAFSTLMTAVISVFFARIVRRLGRDGTFILTFASMALAMFVLSWANTLPEFLVGMALNGIGLGCMFPNTTGAVLELASPRQRGRVMGFMSSFFFLGQFLSPLLTGWIQIATGSLGRVFLSAAALLALMSLAYAFFKWRAIGISAGVRS